MLKRITAIMLALVMAVSLFSCGEEQDEQKVFTCAELSITLSADYREATPTDSTNMLLTDGKSTVTFKRLSVIDAEEEGISPSYTDFQFAEFFLINSDIDGVIARYADTPYYTYYDGEGASRLFCLSAFYRTPYAYFIVIFATSASREADAREEYFAALKSVVYEIVD